MNKNMSKKLVASIVTILVLSLALASVVFAAGQYKNIKAWFGDIKIFRNGTQIQLTPAPFIVDGTTYVPLRTLSNLFDKEIYWDGTNYRIDINDKVGQMTVEDFNNAMKVLQEKQKEINELKAKIEELEKKSDIKSITKSDLKELEDYLNKRHDRYEDIKFNISLSEKKGTISVIIYMDDRYGDWDKLSNKNAKGYIQDVVDDILYDYKNADVEGYIEDDYSRDELVYFHLDSKGNLVVDYDYNSGSSSLSGMQKYLNDYHYRYGGVNFSYRLYGDKYDIEVRITADDWYYLNSDEKEDFLEDIYDEIIYDFPNADVEGYVYDENTGDTIDFSFTSSGYVKIY